MTKNLAISGTKLSYSPLGAVDGGRSLWDGVADLICSPLRTN